MHGEDLDCLGWMDCLWRNMSTGWWCCPSRTQFVLDAQQGSRKGTVNCAVLKRNGNWPKLQNSEVLVLHAAL